MNLEFNRQIKKLMAPIWRRALLTVSRGVIKLLAEENGKILVQASLMKGEVRDSLELFQHYGFASMPLDGAEMAGVFVGGNRHHGLIIATEDKRYRLQGMEKGEVALYSDEGDYIHFKRNNEIHIGASTKLRIDSPLVEFTGDVDITGSVQVDTNINADGTIIDGAGNTNNHSHP
ncbi:MAG: phage baseplate assembly protein V [Gammaproteobacteria bacterium]|nr:phage baseplate assembly protein V [Gammaproteobacteria bacterium]